MVFEKRAQRKIFVTNRDDVTGQWRRLHNEKIITSGNIIRVIKLKRMRWARHAVRTGTRRGARRVLVGSPEGNRSLGRPRLKWEDNIKMDIQDVW
jgi:hypothetical protein